MSTFCAKIGEFSYFLWNSSKSPPFWINPTDPHPQKSVPPFGPKIPQNGKIPPFWPHWFTYSRAILSRKYGRFAPRLVVRARYEENENNWLSSLLSQARSTQLLYGRYSFDCRLLRVRSGRRFGSAAEVGWVALSQGYAGQHSYKLELNFSREQFLVLRRPKQIQSIQLHQQAS